ncbi:MAG: replicative DNA helicase [Bacillota bacterium]|nr:replicative DNA helicase [Bacillota bacterium]
MDELLNRKVPYSMEAEQAVLGAMLIDPACVPEVIERINPSDFYIDENRAIFETIYSMFSTSGKKVDPVTVLEELKVAGVYDHSGGSAYIMQLMDVTPTAANVREYCEIVRGKSMLRAVLNAASETMDMVLSEEGGPAEIADLAEQKMYAVRQGREIKGLTHIKTAIGQVYDTLDELATNPEKITGIGTGFSVIDSVIGGLNRSDLILLASRPGMGKTSMALNMAMHAAEKSGKSVAVFQLEMSKEQLAMRLLSSKSRIELKKIRTADLQPNEWTEVVRAANDLSRTKLYIDDNPAIKVADIKAKCRRLDALGLIVIDYLQLMQGSKRFENRVLEVSDISRSLKIMAKELNVPVLCLSQLSRASEQRPNKRPMLSDLRESGAIEQDADIVMFLYRDDYYNEDTEDRNTAECLIAKNRHGETGKVLLQWSGQFTSFSSQDRMHHEP